MKNSYRLSVDVGGTFTDVVLLNEESGAISLTKTFSTPGDPTQGVVNGIQKICHKENVEMDQIKYFVHGTTYNTNVLLEEKGSRVALLTTQGFRDVIEIGRQKRRKLYDLQIDKTPFLVERRFRIGIEERMAPNGEVVEPINKESVRQAIDYIKSEGISSVAIVFLHAYVNPEHEKVAASWIREWYPECHLSLSHEIAPEFREYERTITTVMNAYLKPSSSNYFGNLALTLRDIHVKVPHIMKSSGGVMGIDIAKDRAVDTLLSGPAGGVIGSTYIAKLMGIDDIITLDMGGTSTDVALIADQTPRLTLESSIKGIPLKVPMVEIETIGAGGGSIGWIDRGGVLKVGPESAGSTPGPVCYGNGGTEPTVTDANLILGKIDPDYFLGGEIGLNVDEARKSFENLCEKTGLSIEETAHGMIQIANHNMIEAVRLVSIRKGFNPKDFTLFSFGGASPLHANDIAEEMGIPRIVVPKASSELSALGFLAANIRHDFATTSLSVLSGDHLQTMMDIYQELTEKGKSKLSLEGVLPENERLLYQLDLRYKGQAFEIPLIVGTTIQESINIDEIKSKFHQEHERQYGHCDGTQPIEIVTYRVSAIGITPDLTLHPLKSGQTEPSDDARKRERMVFQSKTKSFIKTSVFYLGRLSAGNKIMGPAILDGIDTTIVVNEGYEAEVDQFGNVIICKKGAEQ